MAVYGSGFRPSATVMAESGGNGRKLRVGIFGRCEKSSLHHEGLCHGEVSILKYFFNLSGSHLRWPIVKLYSSGEV